MNGAGSRNKGNSYERKIAAILTEAYPGFKLRRVPASGGLDIKCDIYDPQNDSFPLFVECKNRKTFSLQTLFGGTSDLYAMFDKIAHDCSQSYLNRKYLKGPSPVVIFKGGDFLIDMVMFSNGSMYDLFDLSLEETNVPYMVLHKDRFVVTLKDFVGLSIKDPLRAGR